MRFRIDLKGGYGRFGDSGDAGRFDVLVDGQRRGLTAVRNRQHSWSAYVIGVPLVEGLVSSDELVRWLQRHVDADVLAPRPIEPQFELEV